MKTIIRWLSEITGVANKIREEERIFIGNKLLQDSYWFNGGIMYNKPIKSISNFATLYGEQLKEGYYPSISPLRDDIYKMEEQRLSVFHDREVYGYWSDLNQEFIRKEDYDGEEGCQALLKIKWKEN